MRRWGATSYMDCVGVEWLRLVNGDAFAAFAAKITHSEVTSRRRCCKCRGELHDDCRAAPATLTAGKLPPLVVFELPDERARLSGLSGSYCSSTKVDTEVRNLTVRLNTGEMVDAQYQLLALGLYDGGHYVAEVRSTDGTWMRIDGLRAHGHGCGIPCDPPDYGAETSDTDWEPVVAIYQRLPS